jgi:peptidoglycan-associated lipoprotein
MFPTHQNICHTAIFILAISIFAGCSTSPKKTMGAYAHAEKDFCADPGPPNNIPQPPINICQRIHFDYDQFEIKPEYTECLNETAAFLNENSELKLLVEGHCDERGTQEYNLALGEKRAMTVKKFLEMKGIKSERIAVRSFGEEQPIMLGSNETAWSQNRRADFFDVQ